METATERPSMCIWIYATMTTSEKRYRGSGKCDNQAEKREDDDDEWKWLELMIIALSWRQTGERRSVKDVRRNKDSMLGPVLSFVFVISCIYSM